MAPTPRRFDLDEAVNRPGTYFNPTTEMLIVVDDSAAVDPELFEDTGEETEWVLVSDAAPIDETARDEVIERFEARHHPGTSGAVAASEDDVEEVDEIEPDEEEDEVEELDPDDRGGY
jgi:hypothetical protein